MSHPQRALIAKVVSKLESTTAFMGTSSVPGTEGEDVGSKTPEAFPWPQIV